MDDAVTVMLVGLEVALADELADDERFDIHSADSLDALEHGAQPDAVVVAMNGQAPLELLGALRGKDSSKAKGQGRQIKGSARKKRGHLRDAIRK